MSDNPLDELLRQHQQAQREREERREQEAEHFRRLNKESVALEGLRNCAVDLLARELRRNPMRQEYVERFARRLMALQSALTEEARRRLQELRSNARSEALAALNLLECSDVSRAVEILCKIDQSPSLFKEVTNYLRYLEDNLYPLDNLRVDADAGDNSLHIEDEEGDNGDLAEPTKQTRGMSVDDANERAMKLAKLMGGGFFLLSGRKQAKKIGCSWATWKKTEFYRKSATRKVVYAKRIVQGNGRASPPVVSFTHDLEAVTGEGERDQVLRELIAQQEDDYEPSPLEDGPRAHKVRSRKRI
jgi:hypothetical protein